MKKTSSTYSTKKLDKSLKKLVKDVRFAAQSSIMKALDELADKERLLSFDETEVLPYMLDRESGRLVIVSDEPNEDKLLLATIEAIEIVENNLTHRIKEVLK